MPRVQSHMEEGIIIRVYISGDATKVPCVKAAFTLASCSQPLIDQQLTLSTNTHAGRGTNFSYLKSGRIPPNLTALHSMNIIGKVELGIINDQLGRLEQDLELRGEFMSPAERNGLITEMNDLLERKQELLTGKSAAWINQQAELKYVEATTLFESGRFYDAIRSLNEGLNFLPEGAILYYLRAKCYARLNRLEEVNHDLSKIFEYDPKTTPSVKRSIYFDLIDDFIAGGFFKTNYDFIKQREIVWENEDEFDSIMLSNAKVLKFDWCIEQMIKEIEQYPNAYQRLLNCPEINESERTEIENRQGDLTKALINFFNHSEDNIESLASKLKVESQDKSIVEAADTWSDLAKKFRDCVKYKEATDLYKEMNRIGSSIQEKLHFGQDSPFPLSGQEVWELKKVILGKSFGYDQLHLNEGTFFNERNRVILIQDLMKSSYLGISPISFTAKWIVTRSDLIFLVLTKEARNQKPETKKNLVRLRSKSFRILEINSIGGFKTQQGLMINDRGNIIPYNLEGLPVLISEIKKINPKVGSKKSACFIATATYGDPNAPEVVLFRKFRDDILLQNLLGRIFTKTYYLTSPPFAKLISRSDRARWLVRYFFLNPLARLINSCCDSSKES